MRFCTFNIHGGKNQHGHDSLPQIGQALLDLNPDVCFLQEVDRFLPRSGFSDQAELLRRHTELEFAWFNGCLGMMAAGFGNGVLSRYPAVALRKIRLGGGGEPRCALGVCLQVEERLLWVWTLHLGLRAEWRAVQWRRLGRAIAAESPGIWVLGGDFNVTIADPDAQEFLSATGGEILSADMPTFPAPEPTVRIDFLIGQGLRADQSVTQTDSGSDHALVWSDLTIETAEPTAADQDEEVAPKIVSRRSSSSPL